MSSPPQKGVNTHFPELWYKIAALLSDAFFQKSKTVIKFQILKNFVFSSLLHRLLRLIRFRLAQHEALGQCLLLSRYRGSSWSLQNIYAPNNLSYAGIAPVINVLRAVKCNSVQIEAIVLDPGMPRKQPSRTF